MQIPLLQDVVIILGLSVAVIYLFQRIHLPPILGLLLTGVIAGPNGLSLIHAVHEVEMMAEIGVILLLFIIGLEFSLKTLASLRRAILLGGALQVGLTIGAVMGLGMLFEYGWRQALFLGFLVSLSSTAIVLKQLQVKGEQNTPHGRLALALLIFQDIIVVPMMLLTPLLSGQQEAGAGSIWGLLLRAVVVVAAVLYGASYLIPRVLHAVAKTRNQELFILTVVVICFAVAWGTNLAGLSLALGAFLAGLIISESEYSYQATGIVLPFREIFTSFFFVSIGMLLDIRFFVAHLGLVLALAAAVTLLKLLVVSLSVGVLGYARRTVLLTGLSLFQVGEFAFILAAVGLQYQLLDNTMQQYFLATSILTMAATPFVLDRATALTAWWLRQPLPQRMAIGRMNEAESPASAAEIDAKTLTDHALIIGYGLTGRNIARAAERARIPYVVLELNPENVTQARTDGAPVYYGDATNRFVLEHLHVYQARVAVVAVNDPNAAKHIVGNIRDICSTVHIIVRTHYVHDVEELYHLGASEVIPEEFETSIEIFSRLLHKYLVPQDEINDFTQLVRADGYQRIRPEIELLQPPALEMSIPDFNLSCVKIGAADHDLLGKSLQEIDLRKRYGITVAAIQRDDAYLTDIQPHTTIQPGDRVYVMGRTEALGEFSEARARS